jgi:3-oxoacyl-(acyl-carrier-protein) synthase/NAD(P)-dependent dehydrogenase (short-subunit alcohol dehydrogenase family)/acyl-CoA thioesterase FadM
MHYFATAYTIHFDDTMAYGSHHFLTSFKFQCFSRESFLFGEHIFDVESVRKALAGIHLLTADAYARNFNPAMLGDRVAILLTIEEWQRATARFCFRVIGAQGTPICAGFQSLISADARTGRPIPWPTPLWDVMQKLRAMEEPPASESFRERVLAGGSKVDSLFGDVERNTAIQYLAERYPSPKLMPAAQPVTVAARGSPEGLSGAGSPEPALEAWVFAGQGAFDAELLSARVAAYQRSDPSARRELEQCAAITQELVGGDALAIVSGRGAACLAAVEATPALSQFAIHLQNVLGAYLRQSRGNTPGILMGHSFGEIAAFGVAGCFDLPTGVRIVCQRARAIAEHAPPDGGLLAVMADRATVATEAALNGLEQVLVAGRNHERQTVVSGPRGELERLRDCLQRIKIQSVAIPTPTSFHHPRLRASALAWLECLKTLPLKGPSCPLYSPIGRRFIAPDEDIATLLASQLVRPFDFQGGVSDVTEAGATKFVDCGSTGSLAKIIAKAGVEGLDVICVGRPDDSAANAKRSPGRSDANSPGSPQDRGQGQARELSTASAEQRNGEKRRPPRVAIVGQGCILPAGASSPEQLLAAITEQRNGIVDQRRLDPHWEEDFYSAKLVPDRSTSYLGGSIEDREIVAPAGIDQGTFNRFSRAQRLLCIALAPCLKSLRDAERVMCFIGATADGFEDQDAASALRLAGIDPTDRVVDEQMKSARSAFQEPYGAVREVFDRIVRPGLEITLVDAACASSLYSVALGMHALETNQADAVIAGGVFCPGPGTACLFSQFRGTTATGCRPFDANADGVVFSEGAAVVTLRRVADAERLGLPIQAVVRGVGLSSDGKSPAANVPQTRGQLLALKRCYENYGIDPASIHAVEGHGTSTPVGDNTEVETLRQFFAGRVKQPIMLHSLKGLLGHAGWAAGTASMIAACQYLRHGVFPAQANHRKPSEALVRSAATLTVPMQARPLPSRGQRIAVDGFGFGGSNAHVVLDGYAGPTQGRPQDGEPPATTQDDELVLVAWHEVAPTLSTKDGLRFDRERVSLSKRHVLLPDLVDDMDVSQKLAVLLVEGTIAKLPHFDAALQRETSVLLAQSGKSERGVGATLRVLDARLRRKFAGLDHILAPATVASASVRPSGPYTLQCMMPNVAAGRAALQMDLNGPNFVIDAGSNSLEAAAVAASLLLRAGDHGGTRLAIVTAINTNPWRVPLRDSSLPEEEYAAAFAVTSRRYAKELRLSVLAPMEELLKTNCKCADDEGVSTTTAHKVRKLLDRLRSAANAEPNAPAKSEAPANSDAASPTATEFPIHVPVWVEAPAEDRRTDSANGHETAIVAIVPARQDRIAEIAKTLPKYAGRCRIVVVGDGAAEVVSRIDDPHVIAADLAGESAIDTVLAEIDRFGADVILALESITAWDRVESLIRLATDNSLCELLFLIAQRNVARLKRGELELWGLFPDGWNGAVHAATGPVVGLLKAIAREIAGARVGVVSTRGRTLGEAVECVRTERSQDNSEPEVVYDGTTRLVRRLREARHVTEGVARLELDSHSVVVATGGARGVTAVLVDALLRDHHCTVVTLGRSSLEAGPANVDDPQVERDFYTRFMRQHPGASAAEMKREFEETRARWEAHRTIEQLSALGGRVEYMVADVTDRDQVAGVIRQIVSKYGRIDLLVHGAGVQISTRLENRRLAEFRRTFSVKVGGLRHLTDQCRMQLGKTVATHVLTSAYSIFGNDGQHDYGAANETLDRLCGMSRAPDGSRWSSIAWLAWDGIGMTRGSEYRTLSKRRGLAGLTVEDGQKIFRRVLAGRTNADINVPLSVTEHSRYEMATIPPPYADADGRILERRVELSKIDFLSYHKVRGVPTLPGAWILDLMLTAGLELGYGAAPITSVTVGDAKFHRFVRDAENERNLRVVAQVAGDRIAVWMIGDICHPAGPVLSKDVVFAQAILSFEHMAGGMRRPLQGIDGQGLHGSDQRLGDPYCSGRREDIALSGPFDCLRDIAIGPTGRRARFDPGQSPFASNSIPALMLDAVLRVSAMYAVHGRSDLYVPVRIGRLVLPIGPHARSFSASPREIRATTPRVENGHVWCDRSAVLDENGAARLVVEDAYATRLGNGGPEV